MYRKNVDFKNWLKNRVLLKWQNFFAEVILIRYSFRLKKYKILGDAHFKIEKFSGRRRPDWQSKPGTEVAVASLQNSNIKITVNSGGRPPWNNTNYMASHKKLRELILIYLHATTITTTTTLFQYFHFSMWYYLLF